MLLWSCWLPSSRETSVPATGNFKFPAESKNHESLKLGFQLFDRRRRKPNSAIKFSSYMALLQECSRQGFLHGGLQLHSEMIKRGLESDSVLQTQLLNLYIKCDRLHFARRIFDGTDIRTSIVSWNSMIAAYCRSGLAEKALSMFSEFQMHGLHPDEFTLSIIIKAA
ncbi:Pentatricopeptide repeat-containing protein [Platanthera zijinensis]|uniref:Pentatricopeptide repeat-containing protein n=1 Tax=Platanthera zijinensis TaxID=2320716 RepID=A0AAP0FWD5_9ASPA